MHEFQQIAGLPEFLASPEKKRRHARCYVHAGRPVTQLVLKLFLQNLREHFAQPLNPMVTHRIVTAQSLYCNRRKESRFVAHKPAFLQNDFRKGSRLSVADAPKRLARLWNERLTRFPRGRGLTAGMLIISSAALGGIAVALWNRKTLAAFHELEHQPPAPTDASDPEDEIDIEF